MVISVEKDEEKAVLEHTYNLSLQRLRHDYNFKTRLSYIGDLVPWRRRREKRRWGAAAASIRASIGHKLRIIHPGLQKIALGACRSLLYK